MKNTPKLFIPIVKVLKQFRKWMQLQYYILFNYKTYQKFKRYERLLKKGLLDREKEKIQVLYQASALIPKKTKRGHSKYIPFSAATKAQIKAIILFEFGYKMKALGMKITDDLEFV